MPRLLAINLPTIQAQFAPAKKFATPGDLLNLLLPNLMIGAGLIFFAMLIYAGFLYMGSDGQAEGIGKAQKLMISAIIGLVLVISAYVIIKIIGAIFNIPLPL